MRHGEREREAYRRCGTEKEIGKETVESDSEIRDREEQRQCDTEKETGRGRETRYRERDIEGQMQ
jgi:hypothetical protein